MKKPDFKLFFLLFSVFYALFVAGIPTAMADSILARCDIYKKGKKLVSTSVPCVFSQRQGNISIRRADTVEHELMPQDDGPGHYRDSGGNDVYRKSGLGTDGLIFSFKDELVYVYWQPVGFDKPYFLQGITFRVISPNDNFSNTLKIILSGLEIDNSIIKKTINGVVTGAEVADLNADGSPEIYIYTYFTGNGSYGDVVAYSANNNKSLSPVYIPPINNDTKISSGYRGYDEFTVIENSLVRRFPIDTVHNIMKGMNNKPANGMMRQVQYKLLRGEAGWQLQAVKVMDFQVKNRHKK